MNTNEFELRPEERIVFHGARTGFSAFDDAFIGSGPDRNSELGFHFADMPGEAGDYLGPDGHLLVAAVRTANPYEETDYYRFFGYDLDGRDVVGAGHFSGRRAALMAEGYDAVEYHDGEQTICVAFTASQIRIVAALSASEIQVVHDAIGALEDPEDDAARLRIIEGVVEARTLATAGPGR